ncbi:dual specificity tyrosine-phosphorylation-regulated kinase 2-like, partial [Callorhinchus milii]|uniref:dual specificity tyrosine-phosphorylation-regulated kinase 2-like n=1 Tax=Callorhinchus milii TaxID=7868 RepID=UPI001C3F605A
MAAADCVAANMAAISGGATARKTAAVSTMAVDGCSRPECGLVCCVRASTSANLTVSCPTACRTCCSRAAGTLSVSGGGGELALPAADSSRSQLEQLHYRYEVQKLIGEEGQGLVLQCLDHKTKTHVAVKMLSLPLCFSTASRQMTELEVAKELRGKASDDRYGVIRLLDTFKFRGHNCLVFEFLKKSLNDVMSKGSVGRICVMRLRKYTRAILHFLLYAKRRGIVHGDIKPDNILLTAAGKVRVTDFGCSFYLKHEAQTVGGTLPYVAPELLLGYQVTCAVDMWALGCTVAEMATGKDLFDSRTYEEHLPCCIE